MLLYMIRKIVLAYRVYGHSLMPASIILTAAFAFIIYKYRHLEEFSLSIMIIGRILVFIPVLYLFYEFRKKEFMYYRNLGLSNRRLLISLALIDTVIAIAVLILSYVIFR